MPARLLVAALTTLAVAPAACDTAPRRPGRPDPHTRGRPRTRPAVADGDTLARIAEAAGNSADEGTARFAVTVETEGTAMGDGTQVIGAEDDDWARVELDRLVGDVGFAGPAGLPFQSSHDNLVLLSETALARGRGG